MRQYILEGKIPVPTDDVEAFSRFYADSEKRKLASTIIGDSLVSTVFLGLDHNYFGYGAPILFETMVFHGPMSGEQERYTSYDEALKGHEEMVARVKNG